MKKLLVYLLPNWPVEFRNQFFKGYTYARLQSMTVVAYEKITDIKKLEHELMAAVDNQKLPSFKSNMQKMRDLYLLHGVEPTQDDPGKYHMIDFLNQVEEAVVVVAMSDSAWEK